MANAQRPDLASVFDDMLTQNKKRFDDLYRGGRSYAGGSAGGIKGPIGGQAPAVRSQSAAATIQLPPDSSAARRLNARFGNDWRYEITERRRDGNEAIVLCRVIFGKDGTVRTQFGSANISEGPVAGASDGVRFKMGLASAEQDDQDAFRRAAEAALMNCLDLI